MKLMWNFLWGEKKKEKRPFHRWCTSKEIVKDFHRLGQLMLVDGFKQCVHYDIKTRLDERKVEELHTAVTIAGDYDRTQKYISQQTGFSNQKKNLGSYSKPTQGNKP